MASNREFQNNGIPGAFGSQYGGRSLYSENNPAYTRPEEAFQQGGYHTGEGYGGMRQEAPREYSTSSIVETENVNIAQEESLVREAETF